MPQTSPRHEMLMKLAERLAIKWCADNQFASHKDRGTSFNDGFTAAVELLLPVMEAVEISCFNLERIQREIDQCKKDYAMNHYPTIGQEHLEKMRRIIETIDAKMIT
jgi:hypothetical protein